MEVHFQACLPLGAVQSHNGLGPMYPINIKADLIVFRAPPFPLGRIWRIHQLKMGNPRQRPFRVASDSEHLSEPCSDWLEGAGLSQGDPHPKGRLSFEYVKQNNSKYRNGVCSDSFSADEAAVPLHLPQRISWVLAKWFFKCFFKTK